MESLFWVCVVAALGCFTFIGFEVADAYGYSAPTLCTVQVR